MFSFLGNHSDLIQDIVWDFTGDCYATSCKDKTVRISDARSSSVVSEIPTAHEGKIHTSFYSSFFSHLLSN